MEQRNKRESSVERYEMRTELEGQPVIHPYLDYLNQSSIHLYLLIFAEGAFRPSPAISNAPLV